MKEGAYLKRDHHWYFAYSLEAEKYIFLAEAVIFYIGGAAKVTRTIAGKSEQETIVQLMVYGAQNALEVTKLDLYLITKPSQERAKANWKSVLWMLQQPEKIDEYSQELLWEALSLELPKSISAQGYRIERIKKIRSMLNWGLADSKKFYEALEAKYDK